MTHLMARGGPPGRRGPQRDVCASGKGRNAPGGPPRATEGRPPLTARCVALRLRCANTAARTAPDGRTRENGQMGHYQRSLVLGSDAFDFGAAALELFLDPLIAAVDVIDPVYHGLALGGEPRDDQ